jgi:hypothetical protein
MGGFMASDLPSLSAPARVSLLKGPPPPIFSMSAKTPPQLRLNLDVLTNLNPARLAIFAVLPLTWIYYYIQRAVEYRVRRQPRRQRLTFAHFIKSMVTERHRIRQTAWLQATGNQACSQMATRARLYQEGTPSWT